LQSKNYVQLPVNAALRADYFRTDEVLKISINVTNQTDFVSVRYALLIFSFNFRFLSAFIAWLMNVKWS